MNHFSQDRYHILDLPDEILLIILQKLNVIDILYSFANVNQRFRRLALEPCHTRHLELIDPLKINSLYEHASSIDRHIVSNICQNILPHIHHDVHHLTVDQYSMSSILRAVDDFSRLHSLSLVRFEEDVLHQYLTDDLALRDILTKQITHLDIAITTTTRLSSEIFVLITSLCQRLTVLNFCDIFLTRWCRIPISRAKSTGPVSSTLVKLKINVATFVDLLCLLDGRFSCLSTLIVNVSMIYDPMVLDFGRTRMLPKLKCFSFTSTDITFDYDDLIVPLLRRMINLEELTLYLTVGRMDSTYLDGTQLYDHFLIHMTQLKKFTFHIQTYFRIENATIELPSNEDVQRSFIATGYQQVASYAHTDLGKIRGYYHIYSLPYAFDYFYVTNSFRGGMFKKVRYLWMHDPKPFEYNFFQSIAHNFPYIKFLHLSNLAAQNATECPTEPIIFHHLTFLHLDDAHSDYAKQFLMTKNTHLPRLLDLCVKYRSLIRITNDFQNDPRQFNFSTVRSLDVGEPFIRSENFHEYFPFL